MDFENLPLQQVLEKTQVEKLAGFLTSCNILLELRDHRDQVVVPSPACQAGGSTQDCETEVCGVMRQALSADVLTHGAARAMRCPGNHLLVGIPVHPFATILGVLLACQAQPQGARLEATSFLAPATPPEAQSLMGLLRTVLDQIIVGTTQRLEIDNLAQELLDRYEQLNFFFDLARQVRPSDGLHPMLNGITARVAQQFGPTHIITIFHAGAIAHTAVADGELPALPSAYLEMAQALCPDIAERVFRTQQTLVLNQLDAQQHPASSMAEVSAILATPITVDNQCYGTLNVLKTSPGQPFYNADIALVESVGKQIGIFIENQHLYQRLEDAHQSQKMEALGRLAGGIAHDFNNILSSMLGYSEMTRDDLPADSLARLNLERVISAGYRARDLVQQILTFSRRREQHRKPVQVAPVVAEVLELLHASLPAHIEVHHDLGSEARTVLIDPTQLHQVVMNLCANASHAMDAQGGILEVRLADVDIPAGGTLAEDTPPGAYVQLTVADTGCGMTPEVMERIFDPFFTTKAVGKGTGMGLAMAHGIVKSYGGTITVASERGKGTRFAVLLPKSTTPSTAEESDVLPLYTGTERVLLVDDEEELVQMGQQMLQRLGYDVVATTRSAKALEAFRTQPDFFDVIVTDYLMPDITGEDMAREMLRIRPGVPIILVTGFSQTIGPEQAKDLGFREYLRKPVNARTLGGAIRRALRRDT